MSGYQEERHDVLAPILPLSAEAVSQIKSSTTITSLSGVVQALLENSLDAQASKVEISVDFRRGGCTVEDNGVGIPSTEFHEDGGLGKMHHTSKQAGNAAVETHGSSGTYLTSLAAMSLLTITSQYRERDLTSTLSQHRSKAISRHVPAPASHELILGCHGTRVSVRDLFGNMPVRLKQRALSAENDNVDSQAWDELKRGVAALLLAWPRPCTVRLQDANVESRNINLFGLHPSVSGALTEKSLNTLAGKSCRFDLADALPILMQAGLAPNQGRSNWVPVSASTQNVSVKGAIRLDPAPTKQCQFIAVGVRPCRTNGMHNELYDAVNKVFSNSSFGNVEEESEPDETEKDRRKRDRRFKTDIVTKKQLRNTKGIDRHAMFVFQIKFRNLPMRDRVSKDLSENTLKGLVDVLEAMCSQWLSSHNFRPKKRRRLRNEMQGGPCSSSSPVRGSSVPATPLTNFGTSALKRAPTIGDSHLTKKRRTGNSPTLPRVPEPGRSVCESPGAHFNAWSRIKSGRGSFHDHTGPSNDLSKKSLASPDGKTGTMLALPETPKKAAFQLATVEIGQLSSASKPHKRRKSPPSCAKTQTDVGMASAALVRPATTATATAAEHSSDDFGSVAETDMLTAVQDIEAGLLIPGHNEAENQSIGVQPDAIIEWKNPATGRVHPVNARTGTVLPNRTRRTMSNPTRETAMPEASRHQGAITATLSSAGRPLTLSRRALCAVDPPQGEWLNDFLESWNNPVFAHQSEPPIPVASVDGQGFEETIHTHCVHHKLALDLDQDNFPNASKLSKSGLGVTKVIKQVDGKFILVRMPSATGKDVLVLVDQHAASERAVLEGLLSELCTAIPPTSPAASLRSSTGLSSAINTVLLEAPLHFQISSREQDLLAQHAGHFARWGILYELSKWSTNADLSVKGAAKEHKLCVRTLPPGIAERCRLSPKLLIELLRAEVWAFADVSRRPAPAVSDDVTDDNAHSWLRQIGSCPKGIIDLLNSRACRSAIMFNDPLSVGQCEELMADLSRCAFPFMCAHGRVSMVPLVELCGGGALLRSFEDRTVGLGFATAFKRWKLSQGPTGSQIEGNEDV